MSSPERTPGLAEILHFHTTSIERYGGSMGMRDEGSLRAAIERPWQATFGREHFATPFEKAAALMESIIRRHPFVDGNKRTATVSAAYLLSTFGYELEADQQDIEDFAVSVAVGEIEMQGIALWFREHTHEV